MNEKELEQNLLDINQKLSAFGELAQIVEQSHSLPSLATELDSKNTILGELINTMTSRQEELTNLVSEAKTLKTTIESGSQEVLALVQQAQELGSKVDGLVEETRVQLGKAANEKLANSFEKVKEALIVKNSSLFKWLYVATGLLIIATVGLAIWQILELKTLYQLSFLVKLALTSPFVYFIVFINREYNRTRNLIEEYTFKAAIARSFEAYKEIVEGVDNEDKSKTLEFILESTQDLYSSPMVNIKNNSQKERELSPDILSQAKSILDDSADSQE